MSSATTETAVPRGTAVVTGAAQGLGRAFALSLARGGHDVAILDLNPADEVVAQIQSAGGRCLAYAGDASDPEAVAAFAQAVRGALGPVRVLVNNAGISPYAPFAETDLDTWHRLLRVNLDSAFIVTQAFLPDLTAHGSGRIVNMSSSVVWDAQARHMSVYAMTKAAIVGLTRALAGELGEAGITVNCIAPGIVLTPDIARRVDPARLEEYRQRQSIKHLAEATDIVSALEFLVDERSGHVTALVLPVNGGRVIV